MITNQVFSAGIHAKIRGCSKDLKIGSLQGYVVTKSGLHSRNSEAEDITATIHGNLQAFAALARIYLPGFLLHFSRR